MLYTEKSVLHYYVQFSQTQSRTKYYELLLYCTVEYQTKIISSYWKKSVSDVIFKTQLLHKKGQDPESKSSQMTKKADIKVWSRNLVRCSYTAERYEYASKIFKIV